jgi:hypothetical protein
MYVFFNFFYLLSCWGFRGLNPAGAIISLAITTKLLDFRHIGYMTPLKYPGHGSFPTLSTMEFPATFMYTAILAM